MVQIAPLSVKQIINVNGAGDSLCGGTVLMLNKYIKKNKGDLSLLEFSRAVGFGMRLAVLSIESKGKT